MRKQTCPIAVAVGLIALSGMFIGNLASIAADSAGTLPAKDKPMFQARSVRYQVTDVSRSVAFYTKTLGFQLEFQAGDAFASVSNNGLNLLLSGPGSSGARPMPDGREQSPGGWNRIVLQVSDLEACVHALNEKNAHFRNAIETGPGGKQIQIEDPDGNPVELFEPAPKQNI